MGTRACPLLELRYREARDLPEVAQVRRANTVTELERGHTDQQIGKWNSYSSRLVLAVELPSTKS